MMLTDPAEKYRPSPLIASGLRASGWINNVRAATLPVICSACRVNAGSQTPRLGGTVQLPKSVSTRTTPLSV